MIFMSQLISQPRLSTRPSIVLEDVDWRTYSSLLRVFEERPGWRLTYDQGALEIMSPRLEHDDDAYFLGRLVCAMTEELRLPLHSAGSTTMRRQLRKRGLEADESFWIANAHQMAGKRELDLNRDPPPDLAIEVEVTHSALDRLAIYATIGVPEVWWLRRNKLTFYVLGDEESYAKVERSRTFPVVTPADLLRFLNRARRAGDQNPVLRAFRKWIRSKK
jgi:Uma2 family endonuclease